MFLGNSILLFNLLFTVLWSCFVGVRIILGDSCWSTSAWIYYLQFIVQFTKFWFNHPDYSLHMNLAYFVWESTIVPIKLTDKCSYFAMYIIKWDSQVVLINKQFKPVKPEMLLIYRSKLIQCLSQCSYQNVSTVWYGNI